MPAFNLDTDYLAAQEDNNEVGLVVRVLREPEVEGLIFPAGYEFSTKKKFEVLREFLFESGAVGKEFTFRSDFHVLFVARMDKGDKWQTKSA